MVSIVVGITGVVLSVVSLVVASVDTSSVAFFFIIVVVSVVSVVNGVVMELILFLIIVSEVLFVIDLFLGIILGLSRLRLALLSQQIIGRDFSKPQ